MNSKPEFEPESWSVIELESFLIEVEEPVLLFLVELAMEPMEPM